MLALSKKTDYALLCLAYLAGHDARVASAREIAEANDLPVPLLMQILKTLHRNGLLESTRGSKGGYRLGANLNAVSLYSLAEMLESADGEAGGMDAEAGGAVHPPLVALHRRLLQFLRDVKISDVVRAGHRIDVPLQSVRVVERLQGIESVFETRVAGRAVRAVHREPAISPAAV
ncbi:MAG TPA: Rrf2 family transcriptional regulator [Tepidisphaeraceae bacterium]|jgi:Rrf2 family protein|nr:Rrf2 family transcriptional regulator [Tepidisphaeraceae bacterium]